MLILRRIQDTRAPVGGVCMPCSTESSSYSATSNRPVREAGGGALGKDGETVSRAARVEGFGWQAHRANIWSLQRTAARLLYPADLPAHRLKGVATCRWGMTGASVDVLMANYAETGQKRAAFSGLQTCGLVWSCPCCGARISETRRREMNTLLGWARGQGHEIRMLTLTARHGEGDALPVLLAGMKDAKRAFHRHRRWTGLRGRIVGSVTATEVTHGRNGWHVHFHMIVVLADPAAAASVAQLGDAWRASLRRVGLDGEAAALIAALRLRRAATLRNGGRGGTDDRPSQGRPLGWPDADAAPRCCPIRRQARGSALARLRAQLQGPQPARLVARPESGCGHHPGHGR